MAKPQNAGNFGSRHSFSPAELVLRSMKPQGKGFQLTFSTIGCRDPELLNVSCFQGRNTMRC
ncbi:MAG: hypothetical protein DMG61_12290 [Acidobacteria bacterium]|nr:MAG: hypothetical protein DMG61_12290 [Acidobacteriota bacterium]